MIGFSRRCGAEQDGFCELAGGYGDQKHYLHFGETNGADPTFTFDHMKTGETVQVTYHVVDVPNAGPATQYLAKLINETATDVERTAFGEAWHGRVRVVLTMMTCASLRECSDRL